MNTEIICSPIKRSIKLKGVINTYIACHIIFMYSFNGYSHTYFQLIPKKVNYKYIFNDDIDHSTNEGSNNNSNNSNYTVNNDS